MFKKIALTVVVVALGAFLFSHLSYGQGSTTSTTQTTTMPAKGKATVETTRTTTTPAAPRPVYTQDDLKKMDDTLCIEGFDAKVGTDNKNICSGYATAPDIAYTCINTQKGAGVYPATPQGPCNLAYAEHRGTIVVKKEDYKDSNCSPLGCGTRVECCVRTASGTPTTTRSSQTQTIPAAK